jgi:catechol 2,3-dioxygenase-like lactoylglutathione lyase family enzyme
VGNLTESVVERLVRPLRLSNLHSQSIFAVARADRSPDLSCRIYRGRAALQRRVKRKNNHGLQPSEVPMTDWFARPVLHVKDVEASLRFYTTQLGFTSPWRYDEDGKAHVAQVDRDACALILSDQWPEKTGKGLIFISLNLEPDRQVAAIDALRAEFQSKGVPAKDGSWGYRLLVVDDPDGNQLFFNYPSDAALG